MGITSSSADNYVLRVDEAGASLPKATSAKPIGRTPSKLNSSSAVHPTSPAHSLSKSGSLLKQSSQAGDQFTPLHKTPSSKSTSMMLTQASSAKLFTGKPTEKVVATRCSDKLPWLIKKASFAGLTLQEIEFGRVIGRGLMGTVRVCKLKSGKYFALKAIKKEGIIKHNDQRHINNEKEILGLMNCSFCIKLFGTFQDRHNIYFALEYCPGGELFHRLGKKKAFAPAVAKFYITEIFVALEHVQNLGYVYRDLKPENVLLDEEGHCKLVDFGFSRPCTADGRMHTVCGTPAYLSPEQLDSKLTNGYSRVVDWWSFGVLIYELLTGKTPFSKSNRESHYEIFLRILKSKIWFPRSFDAKSKELVSALCHPQVEKRLRETGEIKVHSYFEMPWDAVAERRLVPPFAPRLKDDGDAHYFDAYQDPGPPKLDEEGGRFGEHFDF